MGDKQYKNNNYTDFYYHFFRNILIISLPLLIISALVLSSFHSSAAELSQADNLAISIPTSCTLSSLINGEHSKSILNGTYESGIGQTILTTYCNDKNGYVVYASGFSNNELGNNKLISNINDNTNNYDIVSGTATQGTTSNWAMKLSTSDIDSSIINTNVGTDTPTIEPAYNNQYAIVPTNWTKVVSKSSGTVASTTGSSFTTTYAVYASTTQPAGNYNGQVRYLLAHPYNAPAVYYMQDVATWKDQLREEESILAVDKRDYKSYYVTKLKDGHVWMTQNLDFDINANTIFNSETTDLNVVYDSSTGDYPEYNDGYDTDDGIIYWEPSSSATTINFSVPSSPAVPGYSTSWQNPYSANNLTDKGTGHNSLGNYYNWTAAIASNDSSSLTDSTYNDISQNPQNSICPKGWRLPTISNMSSNIFNSTNEFARLNLLYNNNSANSDEGLISGPIYLITAGGIASSTQYYPAVGYYVSSTAAASSRCYGTDYRSNYVNMEAVMSSRGTGMALRCVAR